MAFLNGFYSLPGSALHRLRRDPPRRRPSRPPGRLMRPGALCGGLGVLLVTSSCDGSGSPGAPDVPSGYFTPGLYSLGWVETYAPPQASPAGVLTTWWGLYAPFYSGYALYTWDIITGELLGGSGLLEPEFGTSIEGPPVLSAVDDDGFVLHAGFHYLTARDEVGNPWWKVALGGLATSSVALAEDHTIYVGADNQVFYAFSPEGNPVWAAGVSGAPFGHPAITKEGALRFFIKRLDGSWGFVYLSRDGQLERTLDLEGVAVGSPTITLTGAILLPLYLGNEADSPPDPSLFVVRAVDAQGQTQWETISDGQQYSPVQAPSGTILVAAQAYGEGGHLLALDPGTGTQKWRTDLPGDIWQPTVLSNGVVAVGCGGNLCGFDIGSGKQSFDWPASESVYSVMGPPLAYEGLIVANTSFGYYVWEIGGGVTTETRSWARNGADNQATGRAR